MSLPVQDGAAGATFAVKVVPGSSRDRLVGRYGDALKVQVTAAAEAGKANQRLCEVLAAALGVPVRDVGVQSGHGNPHKVIAVRGHTAADVIARLAPHLAKPRGA